MNTEQVEAINEVKAALNKGVRTDYGTSKFQLSIDTLELCESALRAQKERENEEYVVEATGSEAKHIIELLKQEQEQQNPEPLTLEQLRERVEGEDFIHGWIKDRKISEAIPAIIDETNEGIFGIWCACAGDWYKEKDYGEKWLFYDHEPIDD